VSDIARHPHASCGRLVQEMRCFRCGQPRTRKGGFAEVKNPGSRMKAFIHLKPCSVDAASAGESLVDWMEFMSAELEAIS